VWSGGEFQAYDQVLGNKVLLASNMTIMCEHRYIRDVEFISGHQDKRRVHFSRIFERDLLQDGQRNLDE
jgi:hypothetical protein